MTERKKDYLEVAHWVIKDELNALNNLDLILNQDFNLACEMVINCPGRIIFCGVGHSGHIASKSAANMSSLCRPSFFLNAGEAAHGDLGSVLGEDLIIFISNSGETEEILTILPYLKKIGTRIIAIVNNPNSTLGQNCDLVLPIGAKEEAGPIKFAGSSTALNSMAICDALVMAIADAKGTSESDYLNIHPGGRIGELLRTKYGSASR
jgi:arabinose-5-phosphate isomerase